MKIVQLTQGNIALVDDNDYTLVSKYTWCCHRNKRKSVNDTYYAATNIKNCDGYKTLHMHRLIMGEPKGKDIDHVNGNGLDNRKTNLNICSRSENLLKQRKRGGMTSKYVGVSLHECGKWCSQYKKKYLGIFNTEEEAFRARTVFLSLKI